MAKISTKKALIMSMLSMLLCVSMLVGSTFAWFTDTASATVNSIQAGTLDVALYYKDSNGDWKDANGQSLGWVQMSAGGTTTVVTEDGKPLWEPGCTFALPEMKIVNNGTLALKYKVIITGIKGDAKLNEVIDWTITLGDADYEVGTEQTLLAKTGDEESAHTFTVKGHMQETAGNDYQGLSIEGIGITVVATQLNSEYDSYDNDYDKNAVLPVAASAKGNLTVEQTTTGANATVKGEQTLSDSVMKVTYPTGVVLNTTTVSEGTDDTKKSTVEQKLEYVDDAPSTAMSSVTISADKAVASYKLTLPVAESNTTLVTVTIQYANGLSGVQIYHTGALLATSAAADGEAAREYAEYNSTTGVITLHLFKASPIDIVYDKPGTATVTTADELDKAIDDDSVSLIKLGDDIELTTVLGVAHSVTIDFCGKKINATGDTITEYQHVIQILNTQTSANKLTFMDSVGGGEFNSVYGGIKLYSSNAAFELNDVKITCTTGEAISVADSGYYITGDSYERNTAVANTSIVINSGSIVSEGVIRSGNDCGGTGHTVTINGGTIEHSGWSGIYLSDNCILTINNCTYNAKSNRPIFVCEKDSNSDANVESSVVVNNITFTGNYEAPGTQKSTIKDIICKDSEATGENVTVNGGSFTLADGEVTYTTHPYKN